jgi:RNA polymerase sigma factor (sigma-70 family)
MGQETREQSRASGGSPPSALVAVPGCPPGAGSVVRVAGQPRPSEIPSVGSEAPKTASLPGFAGPVTAPAPARATPDGSARAPRCGAIPPPVQGSLFSSLDRVQRRAARRQRRAARAARPPEEASPPTGETEALERFLVEVRRYPLLTAEEERELGFQAASTWWPEGAARARECLARGNLRLVLRIARKYRWSAVDLGDLIGFGHEGLLRAIAGYDPRRARFSTYAYPWIEQAIRRGVENTGALIRLPVHIQRARWRVRRHERAMSAGGEALSDAALAAAIAMPTERVARLRHLPEARTVSALAPHSAEAGAFDPLDAVGQAPSAEDAVLDDDRLPTGLAAALAALPDPVAREIFVRYADTVGDRGERATLRELAHAYGRTIPAIRGVVGGVRAALAAAEAVCRLRDGVY